MTRLAWPLIALFVVLFVAALPVRARPQIMYDLGQISRSMQMYVYDDMGALAEDARFSVTTGAFSESRTLNGMNQSDPWAIDAAQTSSLDALSITGNGSVGFSTHNDDKTDVGLVSDLLAGFEIDVASPYSFSAFTTGSGFVSFDDLSTGLPMPAAGVLLPGHFYLVSAQAVAFESAPASDAQSASTWSLDLQIVPSPAAAMMALVPGLVAVRRRRAADESHR